MAQRTITPADVDHYTRLGFVIFRGAFSKRRMRSLVDAVNRMIDRALAGGLTLEWIDQAQRLPERTSHLFGSDKYDSAFGQWLDGDLSPQIEGLLGGPARLSLFGMLAGGGGKAYRQGWHRDLGKPGAPDEVQYMSRFHRRFVQFNAPLLPGDQFLHIVAASHSRASTPAEIAEAARGENADMPGAMVVEMEPGDIAYYDANLWHRGWNPAGIKRWTLHSAFWSPGDPVMQHEYGQRDLLVTPGHLERLPAVTRQYVQRYLDAYPAGAPKTIYEL